LPGFWFAAFSSYFLCLPPPLFFRQTTFGLLRGIPPARRDTFHKRSGSAALHPTLPPPTATFLRLPNNSSEVCDVDLFRFTRITVHIPQAVLAFTEFPRFCKTAVLGRLPPNRAFLPSSRSQLRTFHSHPKGPVTRPLGLAAANISSLLHQTFLSFSFLNPQIPTAFRLSLSAFCFHHI